MIVYPALTAAVGDRVDELAGALDVCPGAITSLLEGFLAPSAGVKARIAAFVGADAEELFAVAPCIAEALGGRRITDPAVLRMIDA